jgi:dTDP-L-rhamnose 4-epimerase
MRVLVTGAAGFIGSHVVDRLVADGHDVVAVDRRAADDGAYNPGATWVRGDVRDPDVWIEHARGVAGICHHAAMVGLGVDLGDIRRYVDQNDMGTAAGLWALHRLGWRGRLVLASSMVVYGEAGYRCATHGAVFPRGRRPSDLAAGRWEARCPLCDAALAWTSIDEDAPTIPRNVYAATKLHQEHLTAAFARERGVTAIALRYHNVYGPRLPVDTPYAGVASLFRTRLLDSKPPLVFEDGGQTRDFVHVTDVARANAVALSSPDSATGEPGLRAYNVASGRPVTILELARGLAATMRGPEPAVVARYRLGDVRHVVACPERARRELGFHAAVTLEEGLATLGGLPTDPAASAGGP